MVDIPWFNVEYGIYFTGETEYLKFIAKEFFLKSLTSAINSTLNVKNIAFSVYYIFLGIWTCFDIACNTGYDVTIPCYFHTLNT